MQGLFSAARPSVATALISPTHFEHAESATETTVAMPGDPCVDAGGDSGSDAASGTSIENALVHLDLSASSATPLIRDAGLDAQQPMETRSLLGDLSNLGKSDEDPAFDPNRSIIGQLFHPHPILEGLVDGIFPALPGTPLGKGVTKQVADAVDAALPHGPDKLFGNPALNEPTSLPPRAPSAAATSARDAAVAGPLLQHSDPKQDIVRPAGDIHFGGTTRERQTLRNVLGDDPAQAGSKVERDRRLGRQDIVGGVGLPPTEADRTRPELFVKGAGDADEVSVNDIKQQKLEDCYFMAALGAVAMTDPQRIKDMVVDNGDGTFTVTFKERDPSIIGPITYHDHPVTVTADFPDGLYSDKHAAPGDQNRELWPLVFEKAYGQFMNDNSVHGPYSDPSNPYEPLHRQGDTAAAFEAITGRPATQVENPPFDLLGFNLDSNKLLADFQSGRPMVLCSQEDDTVISADHCFTITNVYRDEKGRVCVELYNPWGNQPLVHKTLDELRGRRIVMD